MTKREFIQQGVIALMGNPAIINKTYLDEYYKDSDNEKLNTGQEDSLIGIVYDIADNMEKGWDLYFDFDEEEAELSSINKAK